METILITGGSGFVGRQLGYALKSEYRVILGAWSNESNRQKALATGCEVIHLDVVSMDSLRDAFDKYKPSIVIHAAASKLIHVSEKNPMFCVDVNVVGSQNVARVSMEKGVKTVIGISTDKAVPPIGNIYGLSKAVMERMYSTLDDPEGTRFISARFGNIAWSTGSVLNIWKKMMDETGVIETTGPHMHRYIFSTQEAVDLIVRIIRHADELGGTIVALQMKSAMMEDILKVWTKHLGGEYRKIAERPGDKADEHLIGDIEQVHTYEKMIDGKPHYILNLKEKYDSHFEKEISTDTSEKLTEEEILDIITNPPNVD